MPNLRCLFLHQNCIREISGLDCLSNLRTLNISSNYIKKIENLEKCILLETLYISKNHIGAASDDTGIECLVENDKLSVLDISDNYIDEIDVLEVLKKMKSLAVLYMKGNKVLEKIKNYRKRMIKELPQLKFLDDRPIFDDERRYAIAFCEGGLMLKNVKEN
eukprot:GHVL01041387.1.p1 GENE.GHVL01041387.1~~GHVL01041387.1.p1  ORF type:complete len:162 (-),score=37.17 GHVL01041387.1:407-892(-)